MNIILVEYLDITKPNSRSILENMELKDEYILLQKIEENPVKIIKSDYEKGSHSTYTMKIINPKSGYAYRGENFLNYHIKERGDIVEQLAFELQENEFDLPENLVEPLPVIVETLHKYKGYDEMISHFPDIDIEALE